MPCSKSSGPPLHHLLPEASVLSEAVAGLQTDLGSNPTSATPGSVASGRSPALSEPSSPHVWNRGDMKTCLAGLFRSTGDRAHNAFRESPPPWLPLLSHRQAVTGVVLAPACQLSSSGELILSKRAGDGQAARIFN